MTQELSKVFGDWVPIQKGPRMRRFFTPPWKRTKDWLENPTIWRCIFLINMGTNTQCRSISSQHTSPWIFFGGVAFLELFPGNKTPQPTQVTFVVDDFGGIWTPVLGSAFYRLPPQPVSVTPPVLPSSDLDGIFQVAALSHTVDGRNPTITTLGHFFVSFWILAYFKGRTG